MDDFCTLPAESNQARGIAQFAIDFVRQDTDKIAPPVWRRLDQFHIDSVACGLAALACRANAPMVLRDQALEHRKATDEHSAYLLDSSIPVPDHWAVVANCAAVRELDANGTNFGYNPARGDICGEFGHNDFYPVAVAAAQRFALDGKAAALGMLCLDEIRGRLAEVFSLKTHRIDHVVHGGIASAAVYGALAGATVDQIESAIGILVAHYVPFRAIRAGVQLSDSKGASAALTAEAAVQSVQRAMCGFVGPADIFRNPQALFRLFEPTDGDAPFVLRFAKRGDDFALMGMHFKLGLYEHQSAGAIQGLLDVLTQHPHLLDDSSQLSTIRIRIYEPAFGIIGDPAKRDPRTRQSADHSMVYIVATLLRKALESRQASWEELMLMPQDYDDLALHHAKTRQLMQRIEFVHGGPEYDERYPDGIPTSVEVIHRSGTFSSGLVMHPLGHARHSGEGLEHVLRTKFERLLGLAGRDVDAMTNRLSPMIEKSVDEIRDIYR